MAFAYYSPLTIDHTKVPNTDQTDFPVLVSLTDARLKTVGNGGHVQNASGFDIRPYTDSALTTAITGYELESYDASTGTLIMWVKISSLSHTADTVFYLAYGDSGLSTDGSSSSTWDTNYKLVTHMGSASTVSLLDSTSNGNNGTNNGLTAAAGQINGAISSNQTNNAYIAGTSSIVTGTALTIQSWLNTSAVSGGAGTFTKSDASGYDWMFYVSAGNNDFYFFVITANGTQSIDSGVAFDSNWHQFVGTYDGSNIRIYVDGSLVGTAAQTGNLQNTVGSRVGWADYTQSPSPNSTKYDETRISSSARSADWIATEYHNQNSPGTFETLGTEVPVGGGSGNLFRTPLLNGLGAGGPFFNNPLGRHRQPETPQPWMRVNGIYRKAA